MNANSTKPQINKPGELPGIPAPSKTTGKAPIQRIAATYYILRKHLQNFCAGRATFLSFAPKNRCPSCDVALVRCIETLLQKGYSPSITLVSEKKKDCCAQMEALEQSIQRLKPRIR